MEKKTVNIFSKGLVTDNNPLLPKQDYLKSAVNVDLLDEGGNAMVLQKRTSNRQHSWTNPDNPADVRITGVPTSFEPLVVKELGGIAYIISYNSTTGETEIGTYPSPDYTKFYTNEGAIIPTTVTINKTVNTIIYDYYISPASYNARIWDTGDTATYEFTINNINMPNARFNLSTDNANATVPAYIDIDEGLSDTFLVTVNTTVPLLITDLVITIEGTNIDPSPVYSLEKDFHIFGIQVVETYNITTRELWTSAVNTSNNIGVNNEISVGIEPVIQLNIAGTGIYPLDLELELAITFNNGHTSTIAWTPVGVLSGDPNTAGASIIGDDTVRLTSDGAVKLEMLELSEWYDTFRAAGYKTAVGRLTAKITKIGGVSATSEFQFQGDTTIAGSLIPAISVWEKLITDAPGHSNGVWLWI